MKKILITTLLAVLGTSCLPQDTQIPQSPLLPLLERKSGLIAYIGTDGNMFYSDQAGNSLTQLTSDAQVSNKAGDPFRYYQFPAWAKDGSQLAFVGLDIKDGITTAHMSVHDIDQETTTEVYSSQAEIPFYLSWSPDNSNISFITTTSQQNNIILQSVPSSGGEKTIIDTGSPYYWSWAPDGKTMIVHTGSDQTSSPEHFSFLRIESQVTEYGLDLQPASFQAPAWSPDGSMIALARVAENENQVIVTDSAGLNPKTIGVFTGKTAFAWSFDSTRLAYLDAAQQSSDGAVGSMHIYDFLTESQTTPAEDENIVAFFWSPDGKKIAFFDLIPIPTEGTNPQDTTQKYAVLLKTLNVETEESKTLITFRPTEQFLNILPYFDQYHQSATIWSPDSNNLVLSFLNENNNPGIAVIAASGQLEPRFLTSGYIAFWSWK